MTKRDTKGLILTEAFRLFAKHTYEQVTFVELETATKLSRGAIMYHFKTKELIFKSMCDRFLLKESSVLERLNAQISSDMTLKALVDLYIRVIADLKADYQEIGISNMNKALINITNQATYFYPNFEIKAMKWKVMQVQFWQSMLKKAAQSNEIKADVDFEVVAELFEDTYCGIAYSGIIYPEGIDMAIRL
ncbi:MAG: TetR/AcrR family transcriptional regulator [Bacteroidales bacterium]|nr:TetR/AcrR family transcriptional regulator [Bacteroidales bacterium]